MKKLFLLFFFISTNSFAVSGECYRQRNPMGFTNYDICEITGTDYICVSLEGKTTDKISCFLAPKARESSQKKEIYKIRNSEDMFDQ